MTADVHALTGAYVLDAVSDDERVEFERHLAECDACRQEVAELRRTATRLGQAAATEPPPAMRSLVLSRISEVRQLPPESSVVPLRRPTRRTVALRLSVAAAAVLLVATTVLGVLVARQQETLEATRAQAEEMSRILRSGDAQVLTLDGGDGGRMTVAMSRSLDSMLLLADGLEDPPNGHAFQVWALDGPTARPAGFLDPADGRATLSVSGIRDADEIAVTVEPAGGSRRPTEPKVMEVDLPSA